MRLIIAVIGAFICFLLVILLTFSNSFIWSDYATGLALFFTASGFTILYWGLKPKIDEALKGKKKSDTIELSSPKKSKEIFKESSMEIFNDSNFIINNNLIKQLYNQALTDIKKQYYILSILHLIEIPDYKFDFQFRYH